HRNGSTRPQTLTPGCRWQPWLAPIILPHCAGAVYNGGPWRYGAAAVRAGEGTASSTSPTAPLAAPRPATAAPAAAPGSPATAGSSPATAGSSPAPGASVPAASSRGRKKYPVYDSGHAATCSGVPQATSRPPPS